MSVNKNVFTSFLKSVLGREADEGKGRERDRREQKGEKGEERDSPDDESQTVSYAPAL